MAAPAFAQPFDKRTIFTFSGPVALPGVTLPAGQYVFRLADPNSSGRVVQVLNADGTKPFGLFFTVPAERLEPASTPEVRFMETASTAPAAIRTWWYPGERRGHEFIFPKDQARRLAQGGGQGVLTTQAQTTTTEQTNTADLSRLASGGEETHVSASTEPTAAAPSGGAQAGQLASSALSILTPSIPAVGSAPVPAPATSQQAAAPAAGAPPVESSRSRRTRLPQTATQLPLVAAAGTMLLMISASLGYWRTRLR
jgi:hypothetical protein